MKGAFVAFAIFLGLTIAFGFLSGKVSVHPTWPAPAKTAIHVTFIVMIVLTILLLVRGVSRVFTE